jgi:hypothetical protein
MRDINPKGYTKPHTAELSPGPITCLKKPTGRGFGPDSQLIQFNKTLQTRFAALHVKVSKSCFQKFALPGVTATKGRHYHY